MKCFRFFLLIVTLTACPAAAPAAEPTLTVELGDNVKLELVLIKKGTFTEGSPATEKGRGSDEPQRQVTLTQDFYLGKFPVTVGQFAQFVKKTGYKTEAEQGLSGGFGFDGKGLVQRKDFNWRNLGFRQTDDHPVTLVTYDDAMAFATWLGKKANRKMSLPTEAQWEYACRAGSTTAFHAGDKDSDLDEIGWYRSNAGDGTRPVGQKDANRFGLYDMSGNVYEWCRDWYGPYEGQTARDPEETRNDRTSPARRVLRSGSWLKEAKYCRSAARYRNTPASRNADNGFRVMAGVEVIVERESVGRADTAERPVSLEAATAGQVSETHVVRVDGTNASYTSGPTAVYYRSWGSLSPLGLLCLGLPCLGLIAIAVVIVLVLMRQSPQQPTWPQMPLAGPGGRYPMPDAADDGFWLDLAGIEPGAEVRYRYMVEGVMRDDTIMTEPGTRQFIYTGGRPTDIAILETIRPGSRMVEPPVVEPRYPSGYPDDTTVIAPPIPPAQDEDQTPPSSPSSGGFPAAY
jgi:formylglycine-generating enzyme